MSGPDPVDPVALGRTMAALAGAGAMALRELPTRRLAAAWESAVAAFLDPASSERRALGDRLAITCALSPAGLQAGLEAVLGGVRGAGAAELFARLPPAAARRPLAVILAANLPALAVQPLLPALALRRPVLLKSPSAEPLFAPAFVAALAAREPALAPAIAAVSWPGGSADLEAPVIAGAEWVVAYGDAAAMASLGARAGTKLIPYGPKTSLAAIGRDVDPAAVAAGLARDVALFDQRGCLSIQAIYTAGDASALARALAAELAGLADRWPMGPPGPAAAAELAGVQQLRAEAELRGLEQPPLALGAGTVVVDPDRRFRPSPGRRTVRIHPLAALDELPALLSPWQGSLQGVAVAGDDAEALAGALGALGVSRVAAPGELQSPDVRWQNGGVDLLEVLAAGGAGG